MEKMQVNTVPNVVFLKVPVVNGHMSMLFLFLTLTRGNLFPAARKR